MWDGLGGVRLLDGGLGAAPPPQRGVLERRGAAKRARARVLRLARVLALVAAAQARAQARALRGAEVVDQSVPPSQYERSQFQIVLMSKSSKQWTGSEKYTFGSILLVIVDYWWNALGFC